MKSITAKAVISKKDGKIVYLKPKPTQPKATALAIFYKGSDVLQPLHLEDGEELEVVNVRITRIVKKKNENRKRKATNME